MIYTTFTGEYTVMNALGGWSYGAGRSPKASSVMGLIGWSEW